MSLLNFLEQIISILYSLFVNTTSVLFDRVVNKFKESEAEKADRLIELYKQYLQRYKNFKTRISEEEESQVNICHNLKES